MELKFSEKASVIYHNIFDYPLMEDELYKWKCGENIKGNTGVIYKNNFYLLDGKEKIIRRRIENEKNSNNKLKIAKKAAKLISKIPMIRFVGITGALAMKNASKNSDIDLMIVTTSNSLWTSRLLVYGLLLISGFKLRIPRNKNEKNRLCLNIWMDENDLIWREIDRNVYTAHEMAQITPIVNKNKTYEKLLWKNKWILNYWPNAVKISNVSSFPDNRLSALSFLEKIAFKIQYLHMSRRITREIVTPTRALFHPNNWGKIVIRKLSS